MDLVHCIETKKVNMAKGWIFSTIEIILAVRYIESYELSVCTLLLAERIYTVAAKIYHGRIIEPKIRHRQVFVEQAKWFRDRAKRLAVFNAELGRMGRPGKWELSLLISKLDKQDQEFAMKQEQVDVLREWAESVGEQCNRHADEFFRMASEVGYK